MHRLQTGRLARSTAVAAGMLACLGAAPATQPASYTASIVEWRAQREARLKAPGGWLSVAGLFWLEEGTSRFGADPNLEIALPEGAAPPL
ncbi:MAG TPA: hypothetical protein VFP98_04680, partial [Candidatus Polarisedimenticolia bacterium]|nr:hypothetical protein [Candidatus Polarisedimenticolia bacterium]